MRWRPVLSLIFLVAAEVGAAWAGSCPVHALRRIQGQGYEFRQERVERAFRQGPVVQLLGDTVLYFYRGPEREVRLVGDETAWEPGPRFTPLPGTDLKYLLRRYEPQTRLDYKLVADGRWILDPANPRTMMSGFGPNSEMRLLYDEPWWLEHPGWGGACRLDTLQVPAPGLGGPRTVVVAVPPRAADEPRRLLLVHDGLEFLSIARLDDCLAATDEIPTPIAVCVPPDRRTEEYAGDRQDAFIRWLVETLMPRVEAEYAPLIRPGRPWGAMGASYGGRIVLEAALRHPDRFDRLAPLSPSVTPDQLERLRSLDPGGMRIYEAWGRYDIPRLIPECEALAAALAEQGFVHETDVRPQGHSWGLWRDVSQSAIRFLFREGGSD